MINFPFGFSIFIPNKRRINVLFFTILISVLSYFITISGANAAQPESNTLGNEKKILVVYYSRSGNTDFVAKYIHDQVGGDLIKLDTVNPYPDQYRATTIQAKKELEEDVHPELVNKISNIADYDMIFLGSPNWWGTMSMPVRSFLYYYDLSSKKIALFITHEGSGLGRSMEDLAKFEPNSIILDGLAIRGGNVQTSQSQLQQWLKKLDMVK